VSRSHVALPLPIARSRPPWSPWSRLIARLRAPRLDAALAGGTRSWSSPVHAARAVQLTGARSRRSLAAGLERVLEEAKSPHGTLLIAAVPPCRDQVLHAQHLIVAIAAQLRTAEPIDSRGVAHLSMLLRDGASPFYQRYEVDSLTLALLEVAASFTVAN
jgi:hypothetical protein